jgi:hypothetical protein
LKPHAVPPVPHDGRELCDSVLANALMASERKGPGPSRSDPPPDELKRERDEFLKNFFQKGAKLTEELVHEREGILQRIADLEKDNARLRAHIASDDAIRDLLRKIEGLEQEKRDILRVSTEAEERRRRQADAVVEVESELESVANLYVGSYQLHSSLSPRGVLRHVKELLSQLVGAAAHAIFLVDDAGELLVPITSEGLPAADLVSIPVGEGAIGRSFADNQPSVTEGDSRLGTIAAPSACFPIRVEERVRGVIAVIRTLEQKDAFVRLDLELFKLLGAQAMPALLAARLYTDGGRELPSLAGFLDLGV